MCLLLGRLNGELVILRDELVTMTDIQTAQAEHALDRIIAMAEATLAACDEHGLMIPAIDISSALDKLRKLRDGDAEA